MAAQSSALPAARPQSLDEAGNWFWNFLKQELSPYPGRFWVVGRVTISATIVMLLVMTFRIPSGFQGAVFTLFISRENPIATLLSGTKVIAATVLATIYASITVQMFIADPMTHFLWVATSLFLSFYVLRTLTDYGTAAAFGFLIAGAIPTWDQTRITVNDRLESTLWLGFVVVVGVVVSIVVEYVFRRVHPATDLTEGIESRLHTAESVLLAAAEDQPLDAEAEKKLALYSSVGTSRLRRLILRSDYSSHFKAQMNTCIALVGRLVDISASFRLALTGPATATPQSIAPQSIAPQDRARCRHLAGQIAGLGQDLAQGQLPRQVNLPTEPPPSALPFLAALEQTVALIPKVFAGSDTMDVSIPAPFEQEQPSRLWVADALTNPEHLKFALRGTIAATACYVVYTALDWRGLSTAVPTCFITALSTVGSSRQKQILRLGGAIIGGFIFGMGAQVFVLPYLDSIAGFTPLFIAVTAISAWIATASGRLSYLGVQLALAFYLINLQEFTIQTSLAVARDRVMGVLLGLLSMWLIFDRLWVKEAVNEMQAAFARNLEMFAELTEQLLEPDIIKAIQRIRQLRDQINAGFQAVNSQSDAVLFEFGSNRRWKLRIRDELRRWQPQIRTLLLVQITSIQYLLQKPLKDLPPPIAEAGVDFEKAIAVTMRSLSNQVNGKPARQVPDIRASAARLRREMETYYGERGLPVPPQGSDLIGLSESLVGILAPLYDDIQRTFAHPETALLEPGPATA